MKKRFGHRHVDSGQPAMLRPGYLAALAGVLALVLGVFAWYERGSSRRIMLNALEEGAVSLVEAVARAGENALRADAEIEFLVVERLLDNARHIRDLESRQPLSDSLLAQLANERGLFAIEVVEADGHLVASSDRGASRTAYELDRWQAELAAILLGEEEELVFGFDADELYAVALRRPAGGAIVVRAAAAGMLDLRRSSGTGRLIQEIGGNPGVVYMVVQDTLGILSASRGVEQIGRISDDAFLEETLAGETPRSRLNSFEGELVFETAMPFRMDGETLGLLRLGLSVEGLEAKEARDKLQLVLLAGLLLVLGAVGAGVVTIRQNYALLDAAYEQVQTYSSRILEQMADAVVAIDPAGRIQVFNQIAERLFGIEASAALGRHFTTVLGHEIEVISQTLEREAEVQGETCRCRLPAGRELTLSVSTSLIRDGQGQVETAVVVIQDLTEKVAMEADLQRRDRLVSMGALASGVAHEVRNPLNAINLLVQRLEREFEPRAESEEYYRLIRLVRDEIQRVNRIIKDFLALARPPQLRPQEIDLETLVEKAIQVVASRAAVKGLRLAREFEPVGRIQADPEQLEQVLLNLLGNAVEATEEGEIRVATRPAEEGVEIVVQDTGAGIPPEHIERIFDLYFTTKPEGTGLGLSMVHRIVSEHGGRIEVQSKVGEGTQFVVRLPRGTKG